MNMALSCPFGTIHCFTQEISCALCHITDKSSIDQAFSLKMAGYRPRSFFFGVFMDLDNFLV